MGVYSHLSLEELERLKRYTNRRMWECFDIGAAVTIATFLVGAMLNSALIVAFALVSALLFGGIGTVIVLGALLEPDI